MITPPLLRLRVSLLLKTEKPVRASDGTLRWDYEPEYRLVWTDAGRMTHLCPVPLAPLPLDYVPETLCRTLVNSLDLHLADYLELGGTNCPACLRADTESHSPIPASKLAVASGRRVFLSYIVSSFVLGGLIVGITEYYALSFERMGMPAEIQTVHPAVHDLDPPDGIGAEF